jgi:hypothetical protein
MNAAHASALLINLRRQSGWMVALVVFVGCSTRPADQPEIAPVAGRVTMDGQPLAGVSVVFESERSVLSFGNTVRISTPTMGPTSPLHKDSIPAIYNTQSTLAADVAKGRNVFDFALESKPTGK